MIRGVGFKIKQTMEKPLFCIFTNVNIEAFSWFCVPDQEEVWNESGNAPFFKNTDYTGKEFSSMIRHKCNIVFLKLQAYYSKVKYYNIHSYEDFIKSDCQILMLIYDCEFVEIYSKNEDITQTIYSNAINKKFDDVILITDLNDNRQRFDIL